MRFLKLAIDIWGIICIIFSIIILVLIFFKSRLLINLEDKEAIEYYRYTYNQIKNEEFIKGYFISKNELVLESIDNSTKRFEFESKKEKKYFYEIYQESNGDIILKNSGGIFRSDYDIIMTKELYFDQTKYIVIKKIDENIFLCELLS